MDYLKLVFLYFIAVWTLSSYTDDIAGIKYVIIWVTGLSNRIEPRDDYIPLFSLRATQISKSRLPHLSFILRKKRSWTPSCYFAIMNFWEWIFSFLVFRRRKKWKRKNFFLFSNFSLRCLWAKMSKFFHLRSRHAHFYSLTFFRLPTVLARRAFIFL